MRPSFYWIRSLVEFVYPPICPACEKRFDGLVPICRPCLKALKSALSVARQSGKCDFSQLSDPPFFDAVFTGWDYTPELESLIHLVKYQGMKRLGFFLGKLAGRTFPADWNLSLHSADNVPRCDRPGKESVRGGAFSMEETGREGGILVPIPLHRVRKRERGYNQSEWIARGLSEELKIPVRASVLRRNRQTRTQTKLTAVERERNVRGAFHVLDPLAVKGRTVFLVDDVITTGATLNACAECLKNAGVVSVVGLALARPVKKWKEGAG